MLGAELPTLPTDVAREVKAQFENLTAWLEPVLESGAKRGQFKLGASIPTEAATLVSLIYGAMLAARVNGHAALFKTVTDGAVEKLIKPGRATKIE